MCVFFFLFGALDTYNTVTVVIFIVSHYWFLIAVKKKKIKKKYRKCICIYVTNTLLKFYVCIYDI